MSELQHFLGIKPQVDAVPLRVEVHGGSESARHGIAVVIAGTLSEGGFNDVVPVSHTGVAYPSDTLPNPMTILSFVRATAPHLFNQTVAVIAMPNNAEETKARRTAVALRQIASDAETGYLSPETTALTLRDIDALRTGAIDNTGKHAAIIGTADINNGRSMTMRVTNLLEAGVHPDVIEKQMKLDADVFAEVMADMLTANDLLDEERERLDPRPKLTAEELKKRDEVCRVIDVLQSSTDPELVGLRAFSKVIDKEINSVAEKIAAKELGIFTESLDAVNRLHTAIENSGVVDRERLIAEAAKQGITITKCK